jgi:hypothetical protein
VAPVSAQTCGEAVSLQCGQCTSARGVCVRAPAAERKVAYLSEFDCTCSTSPPATSSQQDIGLPINGTSDAVHVGAEASGDCALALALSCGYPAAGERCEATDADGATMSCIANGTGDWNCQCPRFEDCWLKANPTINCQSSAEECTRPTTPPSGLERPRVCAQAIYEYCQCSE